MTIATMPTRGLAVQYARKETGPTRTPVPQAPGLGVTGSPALFAPRGGLHFRGEFYQGGEELPAEHPASLSPADRDRLNRVAIADPEEARKVFGGLGAVEGEGQVPRFGQSRSPRSPRAPLPREVRQNINRRNQPQPDSEEKRAWFGEAGQDLPPDQLQQLTARHADQLVKVFSSLPADAEWQAAAQAGRVKRGWYKRAAESLSQLFGADAPRFVALLAATSPRTDVTRNLRKAVGLWGWYNRKLRASGMAKAGQLPTPETVRAWLDRDRKTGKLLEILGDGNLAGFRGHDSNIAKALSAPDPAAPGLLGNLKIESFRRNLLGDLGPVTADVWIREFAGRPERDLAKLPGYAAFTAKVRRTARLLNQTLKPGEQEWQPAEVQETVWSFVRTLAFLGGASRTRGQPASAKGPLSGPAALAALTHQDVAQTSEFLGLLVDNPKIRKAVEGLGKPFREGLKKLIQDHQKTPVPEGGPVSEGLAGSLGPAARRAGARISPFIGGRIRQARHGEPSVSILSPYTMADHISGVLAFLGPDPR